MYREGEYILYALHGVCKIESIEDMKFGDTTQKYYILKPVFNVGSTIFVPVSKDSLVTKMIPLLSSDDITRLIDELASQECYWIDFEPDRKVQYKEIIEGSDRKLQLAIMKAILMHRKNLLEAKRKMHSSDELFLKNVEKRIFEEFSFVLSKSKEEVSSLIYDNLGFSIYEEQ